MRRRAFTALLGVGTALTLVSVGNADAAPRTAVSACTPSTTVKAGATIARTTRINGVARTYRIRIPAGYDGRSAVPLILAFHGRNEKSTTFERYTRLSSLPAVVVFPDGLRGRAGETSWQSAPYANPKADDVAFTRAILGDVQRTACVDRTRTYAIGRSNGGGLVALLACRMPQRFAAFAAVSGAFYPESTRGCHASPSVSFVEFHGTADSVIRYAGGRKFAEGYPSIPRWLSAWSRKAHCLDSPLETVVNRYVTRVDWVLCAPFGTQVTHYRIAGGTHRWPGSSGGRRGGPSDSIDATELIWQFFQWHPVR